MLRTAPSPADLELIAHAEAEGAVISATQLEHWRRVGLLPPNQRHALGRGLGSTSRPAPGATELVVWLARNTRRGQRPESLALLAFGDGLAVPEATVRTAFVEAVRAIKLSLEATMPADTSADDLADAAVAAGLTRTIVPARARKIDKALANAGIDWSAPALTQLDPNPESEIPTSRDWTYAAVKMLLAPGSLDIGSIGGLARSIAPIGAAAPLAGLIKYRWPGYEPDLSDEELLNEEGGMMFLPEGDLRDTLGHLASTTPLADLRDAWSAARGTVAWATELCDRVESEVAAGQLSEGTHEWLTGAFGATRLLICLALAEPDPSSADSARTALMLVFVRNIIRILRLILPDGNFHLLEHALVVPRVLVPFMTQ